MSSDISDSEEEEEEVVDDDGVLDSEETNLSAAPAVDASKIKLKSPKPGSKIANLKNTIEMQVIICYY